VAENSLWCFICLCCCFFVLGLAAFFAAGFLLNFFGLEEEERFYWFLCFIWVEKEAQNQSSITVFIRSLKK